MQSLYDNLFLLALDEEKGNFLPFTKKTITVALVGAILADLGLRCKVGSNNKQRLEVIEGTPTGDGILDEMLHEIIAAEKPRKVLYWVNLFSERPKKLRLAIGESLAARNLVEQDDSRFTWPQQLAESSPAFSKFEMKKPLREMIFSNVETDASGLALLNMLAAAGLLNLICTADEISIARRLIHEKTMQAALKNPMLDTVETISYAVATSIEEGGE